MGTQTGRRERKKAETGRALTEAATRLFLAHGYDAVSVADIAEAADTALTTLFAHFADGKQALIFGGAEDRAEAMATAIREREPDVDALTTIERFIGARGPFGLVPTDQQRAVFELIAATPTLRDYARRRWVNCEDTLTAALAEQFGLPHEPDARALARFALETPEVAARSDDPPAALSFVFSALRRGWQL